MTDDARKAGGQPYQTVFLWHENPGDTSPAGFSDPHVLLFENDRSLGPPFIQYIDYSKSYAFAFRTSDDSDPRLNGRDYWIVRR